METRRPLMKQKSSLFLKREETFEFFRLADELVSSHPNGWDEQTKKDLGSGVGIVSLAPYVATEDNGEALWSSDDVTLHMKTIPDGLTIGDFVTLPDGRVKQIKSIDMGYYPTEYGIRLEAGA